jgi:hypothetical protein
MISVMLLGALALVGIAAAIWQLRRDGYRRIPTRR